jgi:hypothetical protein
MRFDGGASMTEDEPTTEENPFALKLAADTIKRSGPKMVVDTIKFEQDGDSCDNNMQFLTIRQEDAGAGPYWIMNTDRWAFSNVDELVALLRRAEKARGGRAWRS